MPSEWAIAGLELVQEILATADGLAAARAADGEPGVRTDAIWALLVALERSKYCCSIADVGRLLRIARQSAHELTCRAEVAGLVELAPTPDDRRILQVLLTRAGRSNLADGRHVEVAFLRTLLNGLDDRRLKATAEVLRGIRHRLARDRRERQRR